MEDEQLIIQSGFVSPLILILSTGIVLDPDPDPLGSEMLRPDRIRIWNKLSMSVSETGSDLSDTTVL
jgi:hypothetical protein